MLITKKRSPGTFSTGLMGKVLRKIVIPFFKQRTGRELNLMQAEWFVQGLFTRAWQHRFALRDRLARPYREIACETEFGPELKHYLPYAYWHFLNGTLSKTISFAGTRPFYFFSPSHVERAGERRYILDPDIPNSEDHSFSFSYRRWARVPLKETYRTVLNFGFTKPLLIISNKFNLEWGGKVVNYLSAEILEVLVERLLPQYTVVYNRPGGALIVADHNDIQDLNEKDYLRAKFPQLLLAEDVFAQKKNEVDGFNHFQLCLYAQCERFISVQGGNSVLASYFGGTNLIFQRRGQEIFFDELKTIYPRLAGTTCHGFADYDALAAAVEKHYLQELTRAQNSFKKMEQR